MKRGRPPKPSKDRQSRMVNIRLTPHEHNRLKKMKAESGLSLSDLIRKLLNEKQTAGPNAR